MNPSFLIPARVISSLGLLLALVLVSCSGPQLKLLDRPITATKSARALTNSSALDSGTKQTMREEDLLGLYKSDPEGAIRSLATLYKANPTEPRRKALAEISSDQADRLTDESLVRAIGHYLDAAQLTEQATLAALTQPGESTDRILYNYCAGRVARLIHQNWNKPLRTITAPGILHPWQLTIAHGVGEVDPRDYDLVVPASWLKSKGIKWKHITQDGFGMAMVGYRKATPERKAADSMMPPAGRGFSLNASFRLAGRSATFVLQNLMTSSNATISGRTVPLAADFSAALAFTYYEQTRGMNKMAALLRPGAFDDMMGIYTMQPYREDKIPLVLVHGLLSTAESWLPFVNLLLADPVVRERYQIVLFNYPTGHSISHNAADLRDGLATFQHTHDPNRRNPRMREMVILGHSMGGIISNMQVRDSGNRLYNYLFNTPLDELGLEDATKEAVRRLGFFTANPDIDRALYLAAPLRGSAFAANRIGQLGTWLIRLPFNLVDSVLGDIEVIDVMTDVGQLASQRPANSVSGLRPDNPLLEEVLAMPVRDGVEIHSIIAQRNTTAPMLEGTDGLVRYPSAHLDEAVSEKVILGANHRGMVEDERTIEEVLRILYLHIGIKQGR